VMAGAADEEEHLEHKRCRDMHSTCVTATLHHCRMRVLRKITGTERFSAEDNVFDTELFDKLRLNGTDALMHLARLCMRGDNYSAKRLPS